MAERIVIRELVTELLFQGSESGIVRFNAALNVFKAAAMAAERALSTVVDVVAGSTLEIAQLGDELAKHADRVMLSVEAYDALATGISFSGGQASDLDIALKTLTRNLEAFQRTGKGEGEAAFRAIFGANAQARLKDADDLAALLPEIADGMAAIEDPIKRGAFAQRLFGESGATLIPMLKGGSDGLAGLFDEAERAGIMTDALARSSEKLQDNFLRLSRRARGLKIAVGEETVPALVDLTDEIIAAADSLREIFDAQIVATAKGLADTIRDLRDGIRFFRSDTDEARQTVAALETGLIFLSAVATILIAQQLPRLATWLMTVGVEAAIAGARTAAAWVSAAAPVVLLAALLTGIVLILDDLITYVQGGESAFGDLLDSMGEAGGLAADLADGLRYLFGGGLGNELFDAFERISASVTAIIDGIVDAISSIPGAVRSALSALGGGLPRVLSSVGQGLAAVPGAFASAGAALMGNAPQVSVGGPSVSVSVSGSQAPAATGVEVARRVEAAMSRQSSQLARDLAPVLVY